MMCSGAPPPLGILVSSIHPDVKEARQRFLGRDSSAVVKCV